MNAIPPKDIPSFCVLMMMMMVVKSDVSSFRILCGCSRLSHSIMFYLIFILIRSTMLSINTSTCRLPPWAGLMVQSHLSPHNNQLSGKLFKNDYPFFISNWINKRLGFKCRRFKDLKLHESIFFIFTMNQMTLCNVNSLVMTNPERMITQLCSSSLLYGAF